MLYRISILNINIRSTSGLQAIQTELPNLGDSIKGNRKKSSRQGASYNRISRSEGRNEKIYE
jgi:hypothetical protein